MNVVGVIHVSGSCSYGIAGHPQKLFTQDRCNYVFIYKYQEQLRKSFIIKISQFQQGFKTPGSGTMAEKPVMLLEGCSDSPVKDQRSKHKDDENVQETQEKFSEIKITSAPGAIEPCSQENEQESKNQCFVCDSTDVRETNDKLLCYDCLTYQVEPIPIMLPSLRVSAKKVIVPGPDGPYEKEVLEGTCESCPHKEIVTAPGVQPCSICCYPEIVEKFFSLYPKQL